MDARRSVSLAFAAVAILAGCTSFPHPEGLGNATLSAGKTGGVFVSIRRGLSQARSTQATFADINEIIFSATLPGGSRNSVMIYKGQFVDGVASASITDLFPGSTTVEADARDTSGNQIGLATASANIVAGEMATVDLTLQLVPTYIYATPTPAPSPQSTPIPPTGVQANLTILDGPTIVLTPSADPLPTPSPSPSQSSTPIPSPTPTPFTTNATSVPFTIAPVAPNQGVSWIRDPQLFAASSTINVVATGNTSNSVGSYFYSPSGIVLQQGSPIHPMAPGINYMALIGRFGSEGTPFYIGTGGSFSVPNTTDLDGKTLYLAVNADSNSYTSGSYNVTVTK